MIKKKVDKVTKLTAAEGMLLIRKRELNNKQVVGLTEVWLAKEEKAEDYVEIPIPEKVENIINEE